MSDNSILNYNEYMMSLDNSISGITAQAGKRTNRRQNAEDLLESGLKTDRLKEALRKKEDKLTIDEKNITEDENLEKLSKGLGEGATAIPIMKEVATKLYKKYGNKALKNLADKGKQFLNDKISDLKATISDVPDEDTILSKIRSLNTSANPTEGNAEFEMKDLRPDPAEDITFDKTLPKVDLTGETGEPSSFIKKMRGFGDIERTEDNSVGKQLELTTKNAENRTEIRQEAENRNEAQEQQVDDDNFQKATDEYDRQKGEIEDEGPEKAEEEDPELNEEVGDIGEDVAKDAGEDLLEDTAVEALGETALGAIPIVGWIADAGLIGGSVISGVTSYLKEKKDAKQKALDALTQPVAQKVDHVVVKPTIPNYAGHYILPNQDRLHNLSDHFSF